MFLMMSEDIAFEAGDPGAVKHGNFINYYSFHPPEYRISSILEKVWKEGSLLMLDIGCNSGDLTQRLFENYLTYKETHFKRRKAPTLQLHNGDNCTVIGLDLDQTLILRANESNKYSDNVFYECFDFMSAECEEKVLQILEKHNRIKFDCIFAFSVSMWIHLNHGDNGLKAFIDKMCKWSDCVIVEPQPWKCYVSAVRRLKRAGSSFAPLQELKFRNTECAIEDLFKMNLFQKEDESCPSKWSRKMFLYCRRNH